MGGYGSGRHSGRPKVGHQRSLDVNKMYKAGGLSPGYQGRWQWTERDGTKAEIRFAAESHRIVLDYRFRRNGGEWIEVNQPVPITWSDCGYGGQRPYFQCPGVVNDVRCKHRVIKLYGADRYFLCRHCYNLAYGSQSETLHDRLLRRANKRRMALGGEPGVYQWIERPKGMWKRTHDRHKAEIISAEARATAEFVRMYSGRLSKEEMEMYFE